MRPAIRKIMAMAGDTRISDKNFRWAIMQLNRTAFLRKTVADIVDIVREEAIIETERDLYTH